MRWFLRIKNTVSKIMRSSEKSLIYFNKAFIPYKELQFFDWPSIWLTHSPAELMYIAYGLVILVHGNIQVTTITIGYIQLRQDLSVSMWKKS